MSFNFRVIRCKSKKDKMFDVFGIHEVYYDDNHQIQNFTVKSIPVSSDTKKGLRWILTKMLEALDKPTLDKEKLIKRKPKRR
jgi:hypothetical protein